MKADPADVKRYILDEISDVVGRFLYYDRKEDQELPRGAIQEMIKAGEITEAEIVAEFAKSLNSGLR